MFFFCFPLHPLKERLHLHRQQCRVPSASDSASWTHEQVQALRKVTRPLWAHLRLQDIPAERLLEVLSSPMMPADLRDVIPGGHSSDEGRRHFTVPSFPGGRALNAAGSEGERSPLKALQLVDSCQLLRGPEDPACAVLGRVLLTHSWPSFAPPSFSLALRWNASEDGLSPEELLTAMWEEALKSPVLILFGTDCASLGGIFCIAPIGDRGGQYWHPGSFVFCARGPGVGVRVGEIMTGIPNISVATRKIFARERTRKALLCWCVFSAPGHHPLRGYVSCTSRER